MALGNRKRFHLVMGCVLCLKTLNRGLIRAIYTGENKTRLV